MPEAPHATLTGVVSNGVAFAVAVVGAALIWALPALAVGRVARRRGRRFWPWFVLALIPSAVAFVLRAPVALLVFFIVVGLVILARDRSKPDEAEGPSGGSAVGEEPRAGRASRHAD